MRDCNQTYDELDLLAAEFSLGLLSPEERAFVEDHFLTNATFRALVADWDMFLAPLAESYGTEKAPDVWQTLQKEFCGRKPNEVLSELMQYTAFIPILIGAKLSLIFMIMAIILRR